MSLDVFAVARRTPDAVAVSDGERDYDYAELASRCEDVASTLALRGLLVPGEALAIVARPTLATITALGACIAHGVPVLVQNPRLPAHERAELAARARVRATIEPDADALTSPSRVKNVARPGTLDPRHPLAIVPTSGTTGEPKLVVLSRRAFEAAARASGENLPLGAADRWLLCLPPSHVGGLSIFTRSLLSGSAICLFESPERGLIRRANALAAALERTRATLVSLVPTLLAALLDLPEFRPHPALRGVLLGGAATSAALLERARERKVPLLVTYGLTEACSQVTTTPFGTPPRTRDGLVSSGRALPGVELRVLSDDRICVRSPALASELLGAALALDPEGFLITDDLGFLDEQGELFVYGRASDRIVSGGENVDPLRVEAALLRDPAVRAACVFGVPDERFGELVAAALVVSDDFDPVRTQGRLEYELVPEARPRRIAMLERLPELPNGKVDRAATRELAGPELRAWSELTPKGVRTPT